MKIPKSFKIFGKEYKIRIKNEINNPELQWNISMKLSILIPSIPERFDKMMTLYRKLEGQVKECNAEKQVEILIWIDNKNRSIGRKRDDIVQMAQGDYLAFVDDDDDVSVNYIEEMLKGCEAGKDLICFRQLATITETNGTMWGYVNFSMHHKKNEEFKPSNFTERLPFHVCGIKTKLAQLERFADVGYGEDWDWMERVLKYCKTEYKINKVLHFYIYDSTVSKAPIESNEIFTNLDLEFKKKDEKSNN